MTTRTTYGPGAGQPASSGQTPAYLPRPFIDSMNRLRRALALALLAGLGPAAAAQRASSEPAAAAPALGGAAVEYAYDDGAGNVNLGPPSSFSPDMLWGNYYLAAPGGELISEIAVAFGPTFPSRTAGPVTFWLLGDPDADADPRNATALARVAATPDVSGNTLFRVAIPPTLVSGAFFVGASARLVGGQDRPARVDTGARADRSWFFYAPDIAATIDSLAAAPFGTRMDDPANVPLPGAFMVRALGGPAATGAEAASGGALALSAGPNPAASATAIRFSLPHAADVLLDVHDAVGRLVATLATGAHAAGPHTVAWPVRGAAAGVYVVRLRAGAAVRAVRVVVAP